MEQEFRRRTVGLVSADDFRKARELIDEAKIIQDKKDEEEEMKKQLLKKEMKEAKRKKMTATLSFDVEEDNNIMNGSEDENQSSNHIKKIVAKDPNVDTNFLPDRQRDAKLAEERKRLQEEWLKEQEMIKNEVRKYVEEALLQIIIIINEIDYSLYLYV